MSVLILDKDPDMLFLHKTFLEKLNPPITVTTVDTVTEAESLIRNGNADIILCRYNLGLEQPTGFDLLISLREDGNNLPFILILDSFGEPRIDALEAGANYTIEMSEIKPELFYRELSELVNKTLSISIDRERLSATQGQLDAIECNQSVGVLMLDNRMTILKTNPTSGAIFGFNESTLQLGNLIDFISEESSSNKDQSLEVALSDIILEGWTDGEDVSVPRWIRITLSQIEGEVYDHISSTALVENISSSIHFREVTKNYQDIVDILLRHSNVYHHIIDNNGLILSLGEPWLKDMGYNEDDILGQSFELFISHKNAHLLSYLQNLDFTKKITNELVEFRKKDGSLIECQISTRPVICSDDRVQCHYLISHQVGEVLE